MTNLGVESFEAIENRFKSGARRESSCSKERKNIVARRDLTERESGGGSLPADRAPWGVAVGMSRTAPVIRVGLRGGAVRPSARRAEPAVRVHRRPASPADLHELAD